MKTFPTAEESAAETPVKQIIKAKHRTGKQHPHPHPHPHHHNHHHQQQPQPQPQQQPQQPQQQQQPQHDGVWYTVGRQMKLSDQLSEIDRAFFLVLDMDFGQFPIQVSDLGCYYECELESTFEMRRLLIAASHWYHYRNVWQHDNNDDEQHQQQQQHNGATFLYRESTRLLKKLQPRQRYLWVKYVNAASLVSRLPVSDSSIRDAIWYCANREFNLLKQYGGCGTGGSGGGANDATPNATPNTKTRGGGTGVVQAYFFGCLQPDVYYLFLERPSETLFDYLKRHSTGNNNEKNDQQNQCNNNNTNDSTAQSAHQQPHHPLRPLPSNIRIPSQTRRLTNRLLKRTNDFPTTATTVGQCIPQAEAWFILRSVAQTLLMLHQDGVIHRSLTFNSIWIFYHNGMDRDTDIPNSNNRKSKSESGRGGGKGRLGRNKFDDDNIDDNFNNDINNNNNAANNVLQQISTINRDHQYYRRKFRSPSEYMTVKLANFSFATVFPRFGNNGNSNGNNNNSGGSGTGSCSGTSSNHYFDNKSNNNNGVNSGGTTSGNRNATTTTTTSSDIDINVPNTNVTQTTNVTLLEEYFKSQEIASLYEIAMVLGEQIGFDNAEERTRYFDTIQLLYIEPEIREEVEANMMLMSLNNNNDFDGGGGGGGGGVKRLATSASRIKMTKMSYTNMFNTSATSTSSSSTTSTSQCKFQSSTSQEKLDNKRTRCGGGGNNNRQQSLTSLFSNSQSSHISCERLEAFTNTIDTFLLNN